MEREFIAHHIKDDDSGFEQLIASMQPRKYSKGYSKHSMGCSEHLTHLKMPCYEELRGLSDPEQRDCLQARML